MKTLRPYQQAAVDSLFRYIEANGVCSPLLTVPVGGGKTVILAEIIKRIRHTAPRARIIVLTSTRELLVQNANEIREHIPDCDYGFYCSALNEKKLCNDITIASIQSIYKNALSLNRAAQIIICDECHTISHNEDTMYRKFIEDCRSMNKNLVVIGLTGTPWRQDFGRLDEGEGRLFDATAYEIDIGWMIKEGYLCKPITPKVNTGFDLSGVSVRGGDYLVGQLEKAVNVDEKTKACVDEIISHGVNRKKWLVFTSGITHCASVTEEMRSRGISCDYVIGSTDDEKRKNIVTKFKNGEIKCLVNVATMTTGVNIPDIDMIALLRPTRSPILYVQMIGRGLRLSPAKTNLMILDFGGVIANLGPIDSIDIRKKPKGEDRDSPKLAVKICPSCGTECAPAQKYCYSCSYEFPVAELDRKAAKNTAVISTDIPIEELEVINMSLRLHLKKDDPYAPPTMRVTYTTMSGQFNEFVCFEHPYDSYPQRKSIKWHKDRLPLFKAPKKVLDALELPYPKPEKISIKKTGKYGEIVNVHFNENAEPITPFQGAKEISLDDLPF